MNDGIDPADSNDQSIPRFTWWDHKGTGEWVQFDFQDTKKISSASVYWFDDTGEGECRVPETWRLLYKVGDEWKEVSSAGGYGTEKDRYNKVTFDSVETTGLRIEVQLEPGFSGGILEWRVD